MNKQNIKVLSFRSDGFLAECKRIRGGAGMFVQGLADGIVMGYETGTKGWGKKNTDEADGCSCSKKCCGGGCRYVLPSGRYGSAWVDLSAAGLCGLGNHNLPFVREYVEFFSYLCPRKRRRCRQDCFRFAIKRNVIRGGIAAEDLSSCL